MKQIVHFVPFTQRAWDYPDDTVHIVPVPGLVIARYGFKVQGGYGTASTGYKTQLSRPPITN